MKGSFKKATREQNLLRMGLEGLPGAGKTFTSLAFAQRLAEHYGGEIAVIDAEHGRTKRYAGMKLNRDSKPLDFAMTTLTDFSPASYTAKIEEAGREGFRVLVIDSFSHEWAGRGGMLSLKDAQPANKAYTGWADINPLHDRVIDAILGSPCHVICTLRAKVKHVVIEGGKVQKLGAGPIQRPGTEYEFEIYGVLDRSHILTITKSMCPAIDGAIVPAPAGSFMDTLIRWLETGEAAKVDLTRRLLSEEQLRDLIDLMGQTGYSMAKLKSQILKRHQVQEIADLMPDEADEEIKRLRALAPLVGKKTSASIPASTSAAISSPESNGASECRQTASFSAHAVTEEQLQALASLRNDLFARTMGSATTEQKKEQWLAILSKQKVNTAFALTQDQAASLIEHLKHQLVISEMQSIQDDEKIQHEGGEAALAAAGGSASNVSPPVQNGGLGMA